MQRGQRRQALGQKIISEAVGRADTHRAADGACLAAQPRFQFQELGFHFLGRAQHALTRLGQHTAVNAPFDQLAADFFFKRCQLARDGGVIKPKLARGT